MKETPIYMIAQGNFQPESEHKFPTYLVLFDPILKEYESQTVFVGGGLPIPQAEFWDMIWVVRFSNEKNMKRFLRDDRVIRLRLENETLVYSKVIFNFVVGKLV
jgi:hypothetical protein